MNRAVIGRRLRRLVRCFLNPRLLLCLGLAWMVTNGWSYLFVLLGTWLSLPWMTWVGGAYLGILWIPFTPEKILTVILAICLLRLLFPQDRDTLGLLEKEKQRLKDKWRARKKQKPMP